ncbi:MAG: Ig-like domain-containing protein, partial [Erysipelotrichaceae bacterium]|nr:Ig-like domain-containing protein [Erysipelotrichaceae bacterium]
NTMKRRILKTFTAILLVIVAIAGFMPSIGREVHAETTKQIVFDEDTINNITIIFDSQTFSKDGITLSCYHDAAIVFDDGTGPTVSFAGQELYILHGSFTFSSSVGKISKIEIKCGLAQRLPSGWSFNGDDLTWQGEPSYSVTMENEAERQNEDTIATNISEITFTIITEDVTGITLNETSLEMKPGDTKTLTATLSPSTATEKEVKWSSSNSSVAKVSDSGVVTAVAAGEAIITATATNGTESTTDDKSASCKVTVKNPEPEVIYYPLWVGDNQLSSLYTSNQDEGWTYEGNASGGTLKLTDAVITGAYYDKSKAMYMANIYIPQPVESFSLTIELSGTNKLGPGAAYGIELLYTSLKITGNGKLIVVSNEIGIDTDELTVDHTEVTSTGGKDGISAGLFKISGSTLTSTGTSNIGIDAGNSLEIVDSTVNATGSEKGIRQSGGDGIKISGESIVTMTATGDSDDAKAVLAKKIVLEGAEIVKPDGGRKGIWDTGNNKWATIFDKEGKIAKEVIIRFINENATYSVVSGADGAYTLGSNKDLVITIKRSIYDGACIDHFKSVDLDGEALTLDEDYTVAAGSTIVTIKPSVLDKLSEGTHTITVNFDDGKVETSLTIKKASSSVPDTPSYQIPKTGID